MTYLLFMYNFFNNLFFYGVMSFILNEHNYFLRSPKNGNKFPDGIKQDTLDNIEKISETVKSNSDKINIVECLIIITFVVILVVAVSNDSQNYKIFDAIRRVKFNSDDIADKVNVISSNEYVNALGNSVSEEVSKSVDKSINYNLNNNLNLLESAEKIGEIQVNINSLEKTVSNVANNIEANVINNLNSRFDELTGIIQNQSNQINNLEHLINMQNSNQQLIANSVAELSSRAISSNTVEMVDATVQTADLLTSSGIL